MKISDHCDSAAPGTDVALEVLVRAYHALAIVYELSSPGAYMALHGKMMPYLLDSFRHAEIGRTGDPQDSAVFIAAVERVRAALDDIRSDVSAVRTRRDEREH